MFDGPRVIVADPYTPDMPNKAKLTHEELARIRHIVETDPDIPTPVLCRRFGVSQTTMTKALKKLGQFEDRKFKR